MKTWPALDVPLSSDADRVLAILDDFSPTAAEERDGTLRVFFASASARDAAAGTLGRTVVLVEVDDEDWAARSQANLQPVTVGRLRVLPESPDENRKAAASDATAPAPDAVDLLSIVIRPSMGFGTGHHATTRLCLEGLQALDLKGRFVLDVGTGSGILAIAASRLGADRALGLDVDPDAIESANENLALNPEVRNVEFECRDVAASPLPAAGLVLANLTGALLIREAWALLEAARPSGLVIVSGLLEGEESAVRRAFAGAGVQFRRQHDEWVTLAFNPAVSWSV